MDMTNWSAPSHDRPRGVTILGSTGSVGQSTVDLIARDPDSYRVEALVVKDDARGIIQYHGEVLNQRDETVLVWTSRMLVARRPTGSR